jgi:hypothetical protein
MMKFESFKFFKSISKKKQNNMRKISLLLMAAFAIGFTASAQKISTKVIDNKGTIKWVIDSATQVITKADSTILYVTPHQLDSITNGVVKYSDTSSMLAPYINAANNGLTKVGQTVQLGGALNQQTTITTTATNFLAITGLEPGNTGTDSLLVVSPNGQVKSVSAADLIDALNYTNGLNKIGNDVKLGGALIEPTTITTDATNVLKIAGLQAGTSADSIVVSSPDGTLKKISQESIALQSGDQNFSTVSNGQSVYTVTDMPANASRVWVFRNGAKLIVSVDYTTAAGVVTLTPAMAALIVPDDIIEVQWVK